MYTCTCRTCSMAFRTQHHEGAHIYLHDTNIADGVEGEEILRDSHWSLCVGLEAAAPWSCFLITSPSIYRIVFSTMHINIT